MRVEQLEQFLDTFPTRLLFVNEAGIVQYASPSFTDLFPQVSREPSSFIGMQTGDVMRLIQSDFARPEPFRARMDELWRTRLDSRAARTVSPTGETPAWETFTRTDGQIIGVVLVALDEGYLWRFEDVSSQQWVEDGLINTQRHIQRLADYAPITLFEIDRNGIIVAVEGRADSFHSLARDRMLGASVSDFLPFITRPSVDEILALLERLRTGETVDAVLEFENQVYQIRYTPVMDSEGELESTLGVAIEITERYNAEAALRENEEKYRAIIENIEDGYYEVNLRGEFTLVNSALARIVGYPPEMLVSEDMRGYFHYMDADATQMIRNAFNEVYNTGEARHAIDTHVRRPDGALRTLEISVALVRAPNGNPTGFRGIVRDVTERKQADEAMNRRVHLLGIMQQVNADLNQTLDLEIVLSVALNAAVILSDAEAGFIALLDTAASLPGVSAIPLHDGEAMQDTHLHMVRSLGFDPNIVWEMRAGQYIIPIDYGVIGRVLRTGQPEWVADVRQDPDYHPDLPDTVSSIAVPIRLQDNPIGVLCLETSDAAHFNAEVYEYVQLLAARISVAIDNARLYTMGQTQLSELRALYAQLSDLEQMKTDMIRIAAHDISSPLGLIAGYVELLHEDLVEHLLPEHQKFFDVIQRAIERISRMSTDILSLERLDSRQPLVQTRINLSEMMQGAVIDQTEPMLQKGLTLDFSESPSPLFIEADPANFVEAIYNLLGNAIKYTPDGGHIQVRVTREENQARVEIEDNGYGIPPALQERLFQPFYRAKTEQTAHIEGTGLGLYLVKRIIEAHGGTLRFRSTEGVGSMFGFDIPLALVLGEA